MGASSVNEYPRSWRRTSQVLRASRLALQLGGATSLDACAARTDPSVEVRVAEVPPALPRRCETAVEHGLVVDGFVANTREVEDVFAGWAHDPSSAHSEPTRCTSLLQFHRRAVLAIDTHHVGPLASALGLSGDAMARLAHDSMVFPDEGSPAYRFEIPRAVVDSTRSLDDARLAAVAQAVAEEVRGDLSSLPEGRTRATLLEAETDARWMGSLQALRELARSVRRSDEHVYVLRGD